MRYIFIANSSCIQSISPDGVISFIPPDEANGDYRAYLQWLSEGNTTEPAE